MGGPEIVAFNATRREVVHCPTPQALLRLARLLGWDAVADEMCFDDVDQGWDHARLVWRGDGWWRGEDAEAPLDTWDDDGDTYFDMTAHLDVRYDGTPAHTDSWVSEARRGDATPLALLRQAQADKRELMTVPLGARAAARTQAIVDLAAAYARQAAGGSHPPQAPRES